MTSSELLRTARQAAGLTQAQLAERLGTRQPTIARLEARGSNPRLATLDRALRATGHRLDLHAEPWTPGVDLSLIRQQLALAPAERLRAIERHNEQARQLFLLGARARGELA